MVKDQRQGWVVFAAMFVLWLASAVARHRRSRRAATRSSTAAGADQAVTADQAGGNMEGKEVRFGPAGSRPVRRHHHRHLDRRGQLAPTTASPRSAAAVPLVNMMLGEVSPGGVGAGLYGMLIFALLAVFIAGLMVGRTPEYLGKKIQATEMKLVVLYILAVPLVVLGFAGASVVLDTARGVDRSTRARTASPRSTYAFTSAGNNNGSAFGGLDRQHRLVQHDARPRRCWSAGSS